MVAIVAWVFGIFCLGMLVRAIEMTRIDMTGLAYPVDRDRVRLWAVLAALSTLAALLVVLWS